MADLIDRTELVKRLNDFALLTAPFREGESDEAYEAVRHCIDIVTHMDVGHEYKGSHCGNCSHFQVVATGTQGGRRGYCITGHSRYQVYGSHPACKAGYEEAKK